MLPPPTPHRVWLFFRNVASNKRNCLALPSAAHYLSLNKEVVHRADALIRFRVRRTTARDRHGGRARALVKLLEFLRLEVMLTSERGGDRQLGIGNGGKWISRSGVRACTIVSARKSGSGRYGRIESTCRIRAL